MLEAVRKALRLKSTEFDDEIDALIKACKIDLQLAGLNTDTEDSLILQAVILYCKSHFGFYDDAETYSKNYEALKITIANSSKYGGD